MLTDKLAQRIVVFVNERMIENLVFHSVVTGVVMDVIKCHVNENTSKPRYILGTHDKKRFFVRSVLKLRDRHKRFAWLTNGQAGTNAIEVEFWGEYLIYTLTEAEYLEYLDRL